MFNLKGSEYTRILHCVSNKHTSDNKTISPAADNRWSGISDRLGCPCTWQHLKSKTFNFLIKHWNIGVHIFNDKHLFKETQDFLRAGYRKQTSLLALSLPLYLPSDFFGPLNVLWANSQAVSGAECDDRSVSEIIRLSLLLTLSVTLRIDLLRLHEICRYSKQWYYLHLPMPVSVFVSRTALSGLGHSTGLTFPLQPSYDWTETGQGTPLATAISSLPAELTGCFVGPGTNCTAGRRHSLPRGISWGRVSW